MVISHFFYVLSFTKPIYSSAVIYDAVITHIDEYIARIVICIGIPKAAGTNFDTSSMLFPKHNLHHILVPLESQPCNTIQQTSVPYLSLMLAEVSC
jgi:hypothetical protein